MSKTFDASAVTAAWQAGQRAFGENFVQEALDKITELGNFGIEWHFIGHLQTNKVKYIAPFVSMIHSVDSFKLLKEIDKEAAKNQRVIPCLLQFHIATEETKYGLDMAETREILTHTEFSSLNNIRVSGVMGMATFSDDESLVRKEFRELKAISPN